MQVNATPSLSRVKVVCDMPGLTSRAGTALLTGLTDTLGLTEGLTAALRVGQTGEQGGAGARGQAGHVADDFHVRKRRCSVHLHGDPPERGLRVLANRIIPAREDF